MSNSPAGWIVDDDDDQFMLGLAFRNLNPPVYVKQLDDGNELLANLEASTS